MPDMREGDLGTAACYLTVERLALQAGVESPFWDGASLLMGGCEEPWYKKPLTPRRLRSFLKRCGGSLPYDDGQRGHAASVFADVMGLHGIRLGDGAAVQRIERTWDGDASGRIYGLSHAAYHNRVPETFASSDDLDEPWDDWICPCRG